MTIGKQTRNKFATFNKLNMLLRKWFPYTGNLFPFAILSDTFIPFAFSDRDFTHRLATVFMFRFRVLVVHGFFFIGM
jgi:hypothetical protein